MSASDVELSNARSTTDTLPQEPTARPALNKQDAEELGLLDTAVDLLKSLVPSDPYVLTIPQDVEPRYHHSYQAQALQWLHETPFRQREGEKMQYQTFHYHEHGNSIYILESSRPAEGDAGRVQREERDGQAGSQSAPGSTLGTPRDAGAPKKKISLNAYKKSKIGAGTPSAGEVKQDAVSTPLKPAALKGPAERVRAETDEVLASMAQAEDDDHMNARAGEDVDAGDRKRKREAASRPDSPRKDDNPSPRAKRARTSSPSPVRGDAKIDTTQGRRESSPDKAVTHQTEADGLPPKLSPLGADALPDRLSPTLPANIEATLKARELYHDSSAAEDSAVASAPKAKNGALTPIRKSQAGISKHSSPVPRNGFRAKSGSPAVRSTSEDRRSASKQWATIPAPADGALVNGAHNKQEADKDVIQAVRKAKRLLVKLRYRKSQREAIKRILNLRARPTKADTPVPRDSDEHKSSLDEVTKALPKTAAREKSEGPTKGVAQKIRPTSTPTTAPTESAARKTTTSAPADPAKKESAKRPAPAEETRAPEKRKKIPPAIEVNSKSRDPSTPLQSDLLSPSLTRAQQATPGSAGLKSHRLTPSAIPASVKRDLSGEPMSSSNNTPSSRNQPSAQANDSHQPPASSSNPSEPTTKSKPSGPKTALQQAWEAKQKRLENLGRELKHASSAHLTSKEPRLAAVKSLESLLAYVLAFTCADEACRAAEPKLAPALRTWRSLTAFFGFVKRNCDSYPILLGVANTLGLVFSARILELAPAFAADTLGRDVLLETFATMRRCADDAQIKLGPDTIRTQLPQTWRDRTSHVKAVEQDAEIKMDPEKGFAGPYALPVGLETTPLRAARAAYAMVGEWLEREKVGYEMKLKL